MKIKIIVENLTIENLSMDCLSQVDRPKRSKDPVEYERREFKKKRVPWKDGHNRRNIGGEKRRILP